MAIVFWQVVVNVGMVTGLYPWSASRFILQLRRLLTVRLLVGIGLVMNVSMRRNCTDAALATVALRRDQLEPPNPSRVPVCRAGSPAAAPGRACTERYTLGLARPETKSRVG